MLPDNVIDTVIFDVGNVLYQWDLRALFAKIIDDDDELDWFLANVVTPEWHFEHDAGKTLADMEAERVALFPDRAHHIRQYVTRFNETIPGPVPGSLEIVHELHAADVPLYAITNFGAEFWAGFVPTAPVFKLFRDIVVSGTEKMVKPDKAIYDLAIARFGIEPAHALFIDDRPENIAAAKACGLHGHVFTDAEELRIHLTEADLLTA